jgi:hypothetical protein
LNPAFHNLNAICASSLSFFFAFASSESFGRTTLGGMGSLGGNERVSCGMVVFFRKYVRVKAVFFNRPTC